MLENYEYLYELILRHQVNSKKVNRSFAVVFRASMFGMLRHMLDEELNQDEALQIALRENDQNIEALCEPSTAENETLNAVRDLIEADPSVLHIRIKNFKAFCSRFNHIDAEETEKLIHILCGNDPTDNNAPLPIHIATCLGCTSMVELILEKCPKAAEMYCGKNNLPIHYSTKEGYDGISTVLLKTFPQGAFVAGDGMMLPLFTAACNSGADVVCELMKINPLAAQQHYIDDILPVNIATHRGKFENAVEILEESNFYGLFRTWSDPWDAINSGTLSHEYPALPLWEQYNNSPWSCIGRELYEDWDQAAQISSMLTGIEEHPVLIDAIGKVPIQDITFITKSLTPNIFKRNNDNKTALTVALSQASERHNETHWTSYFYPIIKLIFQKQCEAITSETATHITKDISRSFLSITIEEGLPWYGIKDVINDYNNIENLCCTDTKSGLLPFMYACADESKQADASVGFEILRMRPDVLKVVEQIYNPSSFVL